MKRSLLAGVLVAAAFLAVFLGVRFGSVTLTTDEFVAVLFGGGKGAHRDLIFQIRLPRVFLGLLVGGGLALAGSVFQALLRNPLAEPFILGISGGAAAGAVLVIALGFVTIGSVVLPGGCLRRCPARHPVGF